MPDLAIVGLGRIGSSYDAEPAPLPRSHVGAALAAQGFRIRWLIDPDGDARARARAQWSQLIDAAWLPSIDALPAGEVDVIALCTPPAGRSKEIEKAIELEARVVIAEKPFCRTANEAIRLAALTQKAGIAVRVNFHRRLDPGHLRMKALCAGVPHKVIFRYGKGLYNYGSHAIDMLLDWFGPVEFVQAIDDRRGEDPSLSIRCRFRAGFDAYLLGIDDLGYDQFDVDFFFADRRIELSNGGVDRRLYRAIRDKYYPGYVHLELDERAADSSQVGGLAELYASVCDHLEKGTTLQGCTAADAAAGLAVLETALRSRDEGGSLLEVSAPLS